MGRRISQYVGSALLAASLALAPASIARADDNSCSIKNLWDGLKESVADLPIKDCYSNFDDEYYWIISGLIGVVGAMAQNSNGPGTNPVQDGCNAIENAQTQASAVADKINSGQNAVNGLVQQVGKLSPELQSTLQSFLSDLGLNSDDSSSWSSNADSALNALSYLSCACRTAFDPGILQVNNVVGNCTADVLCSAFGSDCPPGPPPPPQLVDCTTTPLHTTPIWGQNPNNPNDPGTWVQGGCDPNGVCYDATYAMYGGQSGSYCVCPAGMQQFSNNVYCTELGYPSCLSLQCGCPHGMHPDPDKGPLACACDALNSPDYPDAQPTQTGPYACQCPAGFQRDFGDRQQPNTWGGGNSNQSCTLTIQKGQVAPLQCGDLSQYCSKDGHVPIIDDAQSCNWHCGCAPGTMLVGEKCVAPCAVGQVMLSDGSCCAGSQATTCGTCCPQGMFPLGDTCVTAASLKPSLKSSFTPLSKFPVTKPPLPSASANSKP